MAVAPTVFTHECIRVIAEFAVGLGTISSLGDSAVTQHGHCWATTTNPTTADSRTRKGASPNGGHFSSKMTELTPGTYYYVRAYATNTTGTSYGLNKTMTTGTTIGRRYWWVEEENFHYFDMWGTEKVLQGVVVGSDFLIMDWL